MDIKEIFKMSPARRISLVQEIWDSIPEDSIELSDSIKKELDIRLESYNSKEMELYTLDEVWKKLDEEE